MKVYCKKLEVGAFFDVPSDWEVKSYNCEKGCFIPVEKKFTHGFRLVKQGFMTIFDNKDLTFPESLQDLCNGLYDREILSRNVDKFILLFYYDTYNFCVLTAEENYFKDNDDCEVIEVNE